MLDPLADAILADDISQAVATAMGLEGIPPANQAEILSRIGDVVSDAVLVALLRAMPDGRREEFARALSGHDDKAVHTMLKAYVPDPNQFILAVAQREVALLKTRFQAVIAR